MSPFFTAQGDSGETGYLGPGRVSKSSVRIDTVGCVDEASAAIGLARALTGSEKTKNILLQIQKQLYLLMSELSAAPAVAEKFNKIGEEDLDWLESEITKLEELVVIPKEFIVPGENPTSAALDLGRTIIRRAERRAVALLESGGIEKPILISYLNRLSSLIFVLEIYEINLNGDDLVFAKES